MSELETRQAQCQSAEQALRDSEERYRRLLESVTDYVYTVTLRDGQPVETRHGPNCLAVTGYTAEEYRQNPLLWLSMAMARGDQWVAAASGASSGDITGGTPGRVTASPTTVDNPARIPKSWAGVAGESGNQDRAQVAIRGPSPLWSATTPRLTMPAT